MRLLEGSGFGDMTGRKFDSGPASRIPDGRIPSGNCWRSVGVINDDMGSGALATAGAVGLGKEAPVYIGGGAGFDRAR